MRSLLHCAAAVAVLAACCVSVPARAGDPGDEVVSTLLEMEPSIDQVVTNAECWGCYEQSEAAPEAEPESECESSWEHVQRNRYACLAAGLQPPPLRCPGGGSDYTLRRGCSRERMPEPRWLMCDLTTRVDLDELGGDRRDAERGLVADYLGRVLRAGELRRLGREEWEQRVRLTVQCVRFLDGDKGRVQNPR